MHKIGIILVGTLSGFLLGCSCQTPHSVESRNNDKPIEPIPVAGDLKIVIEKSPVLDTGPSTFISEPAVKDTVSLLSWLGGKANIDRILIGIPYMNANQQQFSEAYVRERIEKSVCVNSGAKEWHYAPYTMGTIYLNSAQKINFTMYLSGIKVGNILFALP